MHFLHFLHKTGNDVRNWRCAQSAKSASFCASGQKVRNFLWCSTPSIAKSCDAQFVNRADLQIVPICVALLSRVKFISRAD